VARGKWILVEMHQQRGLNNSQRVELPWERHQVGLELVQIDVEGTIESERAGDGGDDLRDKSVQVCEIRRVDTQISSADVVDGLVIDHEGTVDVLEGGVGGEDRVVWLDDGG